jgi:hypothetical protein
MADHSGTNGDHSPAIKIWQLREVSQRRMRAARQKKWEEFRLDQGKHLR